jgi:formylglycine-generating enzyme required for sulfatase activity
MDHPARLPKFKSLKFAVDRNRQPGRFLLTGSAHVMTLPRLSESLAGRREVIPLFPFSAGELAGTRESFLDRLFEGTIGQANLVSMNEERGPHNPERICISPGRGENKAQLHVSAIFQVRSRCFMKTFCRGFIYALVAGASLLPMLAPASGFQLSITPAGNQVVVSWPVGASNYVLQTITNPTTTNLWLTVINPSPVLLNNTYSVTYTNNSPTRFFRLYWNNGAGPTFVGMAAIPAGSFTLGNALADSDITDAAPVSVTVSLFYMDTNLVSYGLWQSVYDWATNAGYNFVDSGAGLGANEPVYGVNWYDVVKWCNARSQQGGLAPVYFTDAALTQVYTNGQTDAIYANWAATGYRLPTEAEWEKAARGGLNGKRFPLGNTINESQANYYADTNDFSYDLGPINGSDYLFVYSGPPFIYTSPAGYFGPNGYGLYDMAGNVCEWCWDWYAPSYAGGADPRGPAASSRSPATRTVRGGYWGETANYLRCADRNQGLGGSAPGTANPYITTGFRCARAH